VIPRYYQTAANNAVWRYLSEQQGNPLIVLPTGAGKSISIAMLVQQTLAFGGRVIVLAHRKELLQQNAEKIRTLLPDVQVGIYSAGLKSRATDTDVICAGIQSCYRKAENFGRRELIVIDEVHLCSDDSESMYGQFLADIVRHNPRARLAGLTATPYRTGEGPLCGRYKLFQRICYEIETGRLIKEGFLCPITNRPAVATVDTSGIKLRGGEFIEGDMQRAFDTADNVEAACLEVVAKCHDRHSVLVFSSGVSHAEHIAVLLASITGETVGLVTGDTFPMERANTLKVFKQNQLRWLVNCDVLTTGFDAPCIDAIAVLRATMSPGLFAQIVGRGLRRHEAKTDCLILDFGGNIARHGSLDDPQYGRESTATNAREAIASDNNGRGKQCLACGLDVPSRSVECPECGFIFPQKHEGTADDKSQLTGETPPEQWSVVACGWSRHTKKDPDSLPTLRVNYEVQPPDVEGGNLTSQVISEWVCMEHTGYARTKAGLWWQARSSSECPDTVEAALDLLNRGALRMPSAITTTKDGKWYRVKSCEFADEMPESWPDAVEAAEVFSGDGEDVPF